MRQALGGPRLLLRRLREVMSEQMSAQARLDKIVVLIASNMVAEVCSVYVKRADGALELYATEGLNREAVHLTTMRADEGLVGLIAREAQPLALADAQNHPAFSYKPETGEEIYASFAGVPVLRAGNTLGVLVVQNRAKRIYSEEEMEALQTTAMILAELVAGGELEALARPGSGGTAIRRALTLNGQTIAEGVGLGHVVLHEPRIEIRNLLADDPQEELRRLNAAMEKMRASIDDLMEGGSLGGAGEHRDVLETFRMFAHDRGWIRRLQEAINTGLTAEAAVERVQSDARARLLRQTDPYLRERLHDLDDLANRLLHELTGAAFTLPADKLPENAILVARAMGPAALLDYQRHRLRGLVLEEGGSTSHVAIVARALGIPSVGRVEGLVGLVEQGDAIIVDGTAGEVQVRPSADVQSAYAEKARLRARRQEQYRALRDQPARTKDGVSIDLQMNAGLLIDMANLDETGASGIGLFRTEILFMVASSLPRAQAQEALYRSIIDIAGRRPVTFRTLDIGGDKVLPYLKQLEEENPALGWRAVRIGLDRPALLRTQLRALLAAAKDRDLRIMLPMVSVVEELDAAKAMLGRERERQRRLGQPGPKTVQLGVMLEVPSLLFDLDRVFEKADFISIGTNDLMQFMFAVDRDNAMVSNRFDPLHPSFLRALGKVADKAKATGTPVSICGEIAGRPAEALALIALGFRSFSVSPSGIGPFKAMLQGLEIAAVEPMVREGVAVGLDAPALRQKLKPFLPKGELAS
ncbi:MAG: phosphoenolpyruvate--protein phosphotransferase [Methylobacterium sp.]|jgi:phosphotransferase system enzyme I (PtsP)|nr:phosphoenolpyruvate--protein phosphotransferase [Methylobacterium sp.]MCA3601365.1 phosphoenolpyruvate--protein phosphotransferase [Methylobacterium sp.]MCA3606273.1 phosphoenolpyruvate--protein phosphotransferase [Methylobacterium sp.]MCA3609728.1 phosphoenolpyruvate--protein phosphotransferase [Methylobacterium sp.]MCA3611154.1 phosphoenolpyruvate--protein phosphotransferase [Methylobacterium sp.]